MRASDKLKDTLKLLRPKAAKPRGPLALGPESPFEAVVDRRLLELERQLDELKSRVNGLLSLLVGAVATEVVLRLLGK